MIAPRRCADAKSATVPRCAKRRTGAGVSQARCRDSQPDAAAAWGTRSAHEALLSLPVRRAQIRLQDLPRRVARNRVEPVDRGRALVVREAFAAIADELLRI